jgi:hypothetical protein
VYCIASAPPASAESASSDIFDASGPTLGGIPIPGTLESAGAEHWYELTLEGGQVVHITASFVEPEEPSDSVELQDHQCGGSSIRFYDAIGKELGSMPAFNGPREIGYTTPYTTSRYYIEASTIEASAQRVGCHYTFTVLPSSAVEPAGFTPLPVAIIPSPTQDAAHAAGPLAANVLYHGGFATVNQEDWLFYYQVAGKPVTIEFGTPRRCESEISAGISGAGHPETMEAGEVDIRYLTTVSSPHGGKVLIHVRGSQGCQYIVSLSPASALATAVVPHAVLAKQCVAARGSYVSAETAYRRALRLARRHRPHQPLARLRSRVTTTKRAAAHRCALLH